MIGRDERTWLVAEEEAEAAALPAFRPVALMDHWPSSPPLELAPAPARLVKPILGAAPAAVLPAPVLQSTQSHLSPEARVCTGYCHRHVATPSNVTVACISTCAAAVLLMWQDQLQVFRGC